jgi:hypothetical protein
MYREITRRLAAGGTVVLDGGTGTEIQRQGVPRDSKTLAEPLKKGAPRAPLGPISIPSHITSFRQDHTCERLSPATYIGYCYYPSGYHGVNLAECRVRTSISCT